MKQSNNKRIKILNKSEIAELYSLPTFSHSEREEYFSLDDETQKLVDECRRIDTKCYFILLLGYFRSKPIIPNFDFNAVKADLDFIISKYFKGKSIKTKDLSASTKTKLVSRLLTYTGYQHYRRNTHKPEILERLRDVATISVDPRYVFDECIAFFNQNQIALAGYTTLQDHVSEVLISERARIKKVLGQSMSPKTRTALLKLLGSDETFTDLSRLKQMAKDFSSSQINRELTTHQAIKELYPELKQIIVELSLSPKNLEYYASLVKHKSVYKLRRHADDQSLLYLSCYLYFRYRETNDNLVSAFLYLVRKITESGRIFAKQKVAEDVDVVKDSLKVAGNILSFFVDPDISDSRMFGDVRKRAFKLLPKKKLKLLSAHLDDTDFDTAQYEWEYISRQSNKIKRLLRSIFQAIDVEFGVIKPELIEQFKSSLSEITENGSISTINRKLIRKSERQHVYDVEETKRTLRFEFYLYRKAAQLFESNQIYIVESERNRSLESDLIAIEEWNENKEQIIEKTGLAHPLKHVDTIFAKKLTDLEEKLASVSDHIFSGDNQYVEFSQGRNELKWSIPNRRWKESVDNPIYSQIKHMGIVDLLKFVQQKTGFLDAFSHISANHDVLSINHDDLIACVLANGTNYGLYKMANISDRSVGKLRSVEESYVRMDTLNEANDLVSNAIAGLPIFVHYHFDDNKLYSSIDGQKFECRINTFKARYSSKDFFKGKGVSSLTLVSNHVPVNTKIIGANEYEGHFAFDLLYNNTSDIQPFTLSTDNHGTNNVNFAILDLFGYRFAPRYAKVKNTFFNLFEVTEEDGGAIRLKKDINCKLIQEEWDEIQHIICSLSRKTTTQSTVIRKLSNGQSKTLRALQEYDRLIKCIYLLDYVDNATLRRYVQQALNRGEAYHQLKRAIASVNGNRFRGGNDYQVSQWNDCSRLISNCIIYYNSALLSAYLKINEDRGRNDIADYIANLSPVAWQHINLNGEYSFDQGRTEIDLNGLLSDIEPFSGSPELIAA